ncbi:MAG: N-acetyl-alpha-D-glucosaminyl L-malate synthase BshA, partial [Flavobacteriales bacterium]|nr:N-acetyl-alpha-D-glucosaminyl L-malate synthase BshA [Flavobacteriales bacterium]
MKIGIVCYPTYGGSGVLATELGKALAARGDEVHFITYEQPVRLEDFPSNVYYHEVTVSKYPLFDYAPYELVLTSKLVDVVKYEKLDLLHVHYAIPHASAAYMAKKILEDQGIKIPFVTTLHGTDITLVGKDSSFVPVVTFAINHSDAVTAVSQSLKNDTLEHFEINREIDVVTNFICFEMYSGSIDESFRNAVAPNGEKILVHVSNFRKVKRVEDVIKVFRKVREKMPAKLIMIGDGPERQPAEELSRKWKVRDHIRFVGKTKSVAKLLAISDLFVLTSETESFGLAALEAMACGVPVVSTNAG